MKIKKLKLDNFVKFTDFEIEFDGKVTNLVGINGSGKTTVGLTAIWACLKGISEKNTNNQLIGEKYRFIGKDKATADIELTLLDEEKNVEIKIKNHISKNANTITFDAPPGYKIDDEWVNNLLSVAFMSAKNFTQYSPKEQAILLGIDTSEFDKSIKDIKQDYTFINRQIRNMGEIRSVEKVEKVSISELLAEKDKIDEFNKRQDIQNNSIAVCKDELEQSMKLLQELYDRIETGKAHIEDLKNTLKGIQISEDKIDTVEIINKINNAEEINQKALFYEAYLEKKSEHDAASKQLAQNKKWQEEKAQEKIDYIKSFDFGFDGLSVGDDGGLLLNNRPINDLYFSKGEREIIVAKLHAAQNPGLKVRFIDNFELLDEKNQKGIIDNLLANGFQIITAQVGDDAESKENTVLLRECKHVKA